MSYSTVRRVMSPVLDDPDTPPASPRRDKSPEVTGTSSPRASSSPARVGRSQSQPARGEEELPLRRHLLLGHLQGPVRLHREARKPLPHGRQQQQTPSDPMTSCRTPPESKTKAEESRLPQVLAMKPFQGRANKSDANIITVKGHSYAVLKVIGKGGSSVVYEVYDQERNLRAIKRVRQTHSVTLLHL